MLKLVLLILSVWSLPYKHRLRQYLRLLDVLETWEVQNYEIPVGEVGPAPGVDDPGIEDYGWPKKSSQKKKQKPEVPMLGDSPLGNDRYGDFRDYFREQSPTDYEQEVGNVGDLDLYDEDLAAFHEESPLLEDDLPVIKSRKGQVKESPLRDNLPAIKSKKSEAAVGGYWDGYSWSAPIKCVEGDTRDGWMPRTYTIHMLKLKATCAAGCAAAPNCMAFSWDFAVPMNGRGECTFKKDFDNRQLVTSSGWGSWGTVVVRCPYRPRVNYYGATTCRIGDYRYGYMPSWATMDIPKLKQECQLECLYSDRCMAFSWNFALGDTQMGVCHFKRWYNGNMVSKLDAWGSVVVRCPPTTTAVPKAGEGGGGEEPPEGKSSAKSAEVGVAHHGTTTPPAMPKPQSESLPPKKEKRAKAKPSHVPKGQHEEDPGIETAVGASEHEH